MYLFSSKIFDARPAVALCQCTNKYYVMTTPGSSDLVRHVIYVYAYQVIRRDIARTYPEHEFFKEKDGLGQESLFNVMKAYSLHDREVGYCQGSAFIVGLLLMQVRHCTPLM